MNALEALMIEQISRSGPMDVGQFMSMALAHPQHGYYRKQDPLGRGGDFTTAPEISQMFGEMIGAWAVDAWEKMGAPAEFTLLECGPGRGTLMADMMRAASVEPRFVKACAVHLLEISPVLRAAQGKALAECKPRWHETLETVPDDRPVIVIANEFFDALPVRQLQFANGAWRERVVGHEGGAFCFGLRPLPPGLKPPPGAGEGDIFETSPARIFAFRNLCGLLERAGRGAMLLVDYGHARSGFGDTLQAVHKHRFVDVLTHIGEADLTAHVDFGALRDEVECEGVVPQGDFLRTLGIERRAEILARKAPSVMRDLERLIAPAQMGQLFKVMGVRHGFGQRLAGF